MVQNDGGGSGKLVGGLVLAGDGWFVGGERLRFHGHGLQLCRAPGDDFVHGTEGKRMRVSAVSTGSKGEGSLGREGQQHGVAVSPSTFGSGGLGEEPG